MNAHEYVRSQPLTLTDPMGLVPRRRFRVVTHNDKSGDMVLEDQNGQLYVLKFVGSADYDLNGKNWCARAKYHLYELVPGSATSNNPKARPYLKLIGYAVIGWLTSGTAYDIYTYDGDPGGLFLPAEDNSSGRNPYPSGYRGDGGFASTDPDRFGQGICDCGSAKTIDGWGGLCPRCGKSYGGSNYPPLPPARKELRPPPTPKPRIHPFQQ